MNKEKYKDCLEKLILFHGVFIWILVLPLFYFAVTLNIVGFLGVVVFIMLFLGNAMRLKRKTANVQEVSS